MEPKVYMATLVNGLNYHQGTNHFQQGFPKIVTAELATQLGKVVDLLTTTQDGKKIKRRKFVIQNLDKSKADEILQEYGEEADKPKDEDYDILDAVSDENVDVDDELTVDALPESMVDDAEKAKKPGRPSKK